MAGANTPKIIPEKGVDAVREPIIP